MPDRRWRLWLALIVVLAAALRLVHLDARPIGYHGWRQADTAAIARNFHEQGYRLLYPQVDWAAPGYVETELPLSPGGGALASGAFGAREALARLLAAAASVATVPALFLLVRRFLGVEPGLWAALLWAVLPASVFFGRAIMPESWMLAASVAGAYLFALWLERRSTPLLLGAAAAIALACLLKPTSLHLGLPLLFLAWRESGPGALRDRRLWLFAALVAAPVALWYWHAHRLGSTWGATFGVLSGPTGKLGRPELLLEAGFYARLVFKHFADRILTVAGFAVFLLGLVLPRGDRRERLFDWWLLAVLVVLLIGAAGSWAHDYYSLPLLVPAVATMGRALAWARARSGLLVAVFLLAILLASAWRWSGYLGLEDERSPGSPEVALDLEAAALLAEHTAPADRVVSCDLSDPTWFYLSRRKGWGVICDRAFDKRALAVLEEAGARYLVGRRADFDRPEGRRLLDHLLASRTAIHDDGVLLLLDLRARPPGERFGRTLLADDFEDGALPASWRFEAGEWSEADGRLRAEPSRGRLRAAIDRGLEPCGPCALRLTLAATVPSPAPRRASVSVRGWRREDSHVEVTLDFSAGRVVFVQREGGAVVGRRAADRPLAGGRESLLEIRYDLFDFEVLLDGESVLSAPDRAESRPTGGLEVGASRLGLALDRLEVLAPPAPGAAGP